MQRRNERGSSSSSSSSSEKLKVSDQPSPTSRKKEIIEKWTQGRSLKTTSSAGMNVDNSEEAGEVAILFMTVTGRDADFSEIKREEQSEGDDELSNEDVVSSSGEKSKLRFS